MLKSKRIILFKEMFVDKLLIFINVMVILYSIYSDEFFIFEFKEIFISFNYFCKEYL